MKTLLLAAFLLTFVGALRAQQVAAPRFSPTAGTYTSAQRVAITTTTSGASIRYTTDGRDPSATSTLYSAPINVSQTTTIKARAFRSGQTDSPIASATFTITLPVATPTISPGSGTYTSSQRVTIATATSGATVRYTTDGRDPTPNSAIYSAPLTISVTTTLKAKAFRSGQPDSQTASATYSISIPVATPVFSVASGTYSSAQTIRISTTTEGATIRFTTDGRDPTSSSTVYNSPILVSNTATLKARAFKAGSADSGIASAVYTITLPVATPRASPAAGTYSNAQSVALTTATDGATIRYTTNGSEPTANSLVYSRPISVSASTTLRARAFKSGLADSAILTAAYNIATPVATPTFSPTEGRYSVDLSVAIRSATEGATIRYTVNGLEPDGKSTVYTAPVKIDSTTTIKARAFKAGLADSAVATAVFTLSKPVAAPTFDPAPGSVTKGQNVRITSATTGAIIRYTTNGSEPSSASAAYSAPILVSSTMTLKAKAFKAGSTESATVSAAYTVLDPVAAPKISPTGGTFSESQRVSISTTTRGATIRYTTNGGEPTAASPAYSTPIPVSATTTIKAKAFMAERAPSETITATFTIKAKVDAPTFSPPPGSGIHSVAPTVSLFNTTPGAIIRYTLNGAEPTHNSIAYSTPIKLDATTTLKAKAFKADMTDSETATATYLIGDAFESDNSPDRAKAVANGVAQSRSIHASGDVDWAKFTLTTRGEVTIETDGTRGDTQIWLYGPGNASTEIATNDDKSGSSDFSLIQRAGERSLASGTYYVKVTGNGSDGIVPAYTLRVTWKDVDDPADKYEPDNSVSGAKTIANGETQTRSIHRAGDIDLVTFTIDREGATNARMETTLSNGSLDMVLYGPDNPTTEVARNGTEAAARVTRESLAAGKYYLRISERGNDGAVPSYSVKVSWEAKPRITTLANAQVVTGVSGRKGSQASYRVEVPTGMRGLEVNLWGGASAEVFVIRDDGSGSVPTAKRFDAASAAVSAFNKQVIMKEANPGTYLITIAGAGTFSNASLKAIVGNPPRVVLLLHGMDSSPATWDSFIKDRIERAGKDPAVDRNMVGSIFGGKIIGKAASPLDGVLYYTLDFGALDKTGAAADAVKQHGMRMSGETAGLPSNNSATVPEDRIPSEDDQDGDFSTFDHLGTEVEGAVEAILNEHRDARIAFVCHSRGGLAARNFIQRASGEERVFVDAIITLGTPHLGSRLGWLYEHLRLNPYKQELARTNGDWNFAKLAALTGSEYNVGVDLGKPTVKMLRDAADDINELNKGVVNLPNHVRYGGIVFKDVAFCHIAIPLFPLLSGTCEEYLLGTPTKKTKGELAGDGIVSEDSQRWENLPKWSSPENPRAAVASSTLQGFNHLEQTERSGDIGLRIKVILGW